MTQQATSATEPTTAAYRKAQADRQTAIQAYTDALKALEAARGRGDKKAVLAISGKMGTPTAKVREAEYEMACEGWTGEPWTKPVTATTKRLPDIGTAAEVQAKLDKHRAMYKANKDLRPTVAAKAQEHETALLKAAKARGLKVS